MGTKASGGKCSDLLCGGAFGFSRPRRQDLFFFSIANLPAPFLSSRDLPSPSPSLLCRALQPPPRGPLGATLGSICCWFTRFFGIGSSRSRPNKSDLKEWGTEQKATAAAGAESGFYHHKSSHWWDILSNGSFFLTGGVIDFSLQTPLDILQATFRTSVFFTMYVQYLYTKPGMDAWLVSSQDPKCLIDLNRACIIDETTFNVFPECLLCY